MTDRLVDAVRAYLLEHDTYHAQCRDRDAMRHREPGFYVEALGRQQRLLAEVRNALPPLSQPRALPFGEDVACMRFDCPEGHPMFGGYRTSEGEPCWLCPNCGTPGVFRAVDVRTEA